jgi:hypothetical protein
LDLDPESGAFRKHLESALNFRGEVKNSFHGYIIKNIPLEISGEMRFRSSEKYFLALVSGCTLYHTIFPNAEKTLFSNLEENQKILTLYENALFNNVFDLSVVERAILDQLGEEPVSLSEVKERVYQIYSGINRELYKESLDRLASKEALVETDGNCIYRHPLPKIQLNPEEALTYAEEKMRAYCPEKRDEWLERNLKQLEHQVRSEEMPQMIPPVVPPADGGLSDG